MEKLILSIFAILSLYLLNTQILLASTKCQSYEKHTLPEIDLVERSDWINIKTDIISQAAGDGLSDDTKAIQSALNKLGLRPGEPKVLYFPPGTYRITKTLSALNTDKKRKEGLSGILLVGHGSKTKILWDGDVGGRMFWSNGIHRSKFNGITWDGNNIAAVGIDHNAKYRFETRIYHQNMAFYNFTEAGIKVQHNQKTNEFASAEIYYKNLIFKNNHVGALINQFNNYNHYFNGCHFINNTIGLNVPLGNAVVHNSRFENSIITDINFGAHSFGVRRSVSVGSNKFITTPNIGGNGSIITVDNCVVDSWKNSSGAISTSGRGPLIAFDTKFTNPPKKSPAINFSNGLIAPHQIGIFSNLQFNSPSNLINNGLDSNITYTIPSQQNYFKNSLDKHSNFIEIPRRSPHTIIDAKLDCNAKGNGKSDDSKSIQDCIERANNYKDGKYIEIYFPSGEYIVKTPISVYGNNLSLSGTGRHSLLNWKGENAEPIFKVSDTYGVSIQNLGFTTNQSSRILIDHSDLKGQPSSTHYENLYLWSTDQDGVVSISALAKNSVSKLEFIHSNIDIHDTSGATILGKFLVSHLSVNKKSNQSDDFIGISGMVSLLGNYQLKVKNNRSLVISDWYSEQSNRMHQFSGSPPYLPGRVTLHHTKAYAHKKRKDDNFTSSNYHGQITHIGGLFAGVDLKTGKWFQRHHAYQGDKPLDLVYIGNQFMVYPINLLTHPNTNVILIGNNIEGLGHTKDNYQHDLHAEITTPIRYAFDDFKRLGEKDLEHFSCIENNL